MNTTIKKNYPYVGTATETEAYQVCTYAQASHWKDANTSFQWLNFEYPVYHGHTDWEITIVLNDCIVNYIKINTTLGLAEEYGCIS